MTLFAYVSTGGPAYAHLAPCHPGLCEIHPLPICLSCLLPPPPGASHHHPVPAASTCQQPPPLASICQPAISQPSAQPAASQPATCQPPARPITHQAQLPSRHLSRPASRQPPAASEAQQEAQPASHLPSQQPPAGSASHPRPPPASPMIEALASAPPHVNLCCSCPSAALRAVADSFAPVSLLPAPPLPPFFASNNALPLLPAAALPPAFLLARPASHKCRCRAPPLITLPVCWYRSSVTRFCNHEYNARGIHTAAGARAGMR
ncbi:uncharacterized protein PSFLO_07162 [Pseudozyma flocculosa]|uniref:Uncharacterized protein n=1 Tax=Pseudozyma flocculosa TaxID=84751 RepID=A0A5C3FBN4_9BASI|nr:uncharacterized protein PSFLO_07162 [Pseudozyma flocculosa]